MAEEVRTHSGLGFVGLGGSISIGEVRMEEEPAQTETRQCLCFGAKSPGFTSLP